MFQKEVGEKILNPGFLNTIINLHASIKKVCDVNPKCFSPAPKVWSTIFLFEYKKQSNNYIQNKITQLYRNPNKKLKHNMLFIQDIYKEKRIKQLSFNQVRDIILYE